MITQHQELRSTREETGISASWLENITATSHNEIQESHKKPKRDQRDRRLITCMQENFEVGFNRVVEAYSKQLYRVAYHVLETTGLAHLAEDAVQECLIKAFLSLKTSHIKDPNSFAKMKLRAWLYTIVRNEAINFLRAGDRTIELRDGQPYSEEISWDAKPSYMVSVAVIGPENHVERQETIKEAKQLTRQILDKLNSIERQVLERKYLSEESTDLKQVTFEQIAKEMDIPVGTAKSAASRGRSQMRKILTHHWEQEGYKIQKHIALEELLGTRANISWPSILKSGHPSD